jgi:hypothetical protein
MAGGVIVLRVRQREHKGREEEDGEEGKKPVV